MANGLNKYQELESNKNKKKTQRETERQGLQNKRNINY